MRDGPRPLARPAAGPGTEAHPVGRSHASGRPRVVVVGLGPGDPGLLTVATRDAIAAIPARFVRTSRHPSAAAVGGAIAFDDVYEQASAVEDVYATIAARVAAAALTAGEVLYAVPGSPLVAERTVELLRGDERISVEVLPALSFLDLAWARLGIDPVAVGARLVDGHRFATEAAGSAGPLLVAQCDRALVLSDIKLSVESDPGPVVVLQRLGLADEAVFEVAWADLDRAFTPDHLTCIWIDRLAEPVAGETVRLVELVRTLRERCPWDRRQTHRSLGRHLLEESYEVLDAIEELPPGAPGPDAVVDVTTGGPPGPGVSGGPGGDEPGAGGVQGVGVDEAWDHLEEELGDLLFQVVFHSVLGTEAGRFGFADVARGVHDKLVERHPHVFGGAEAVSAADVVRGWEQRKMQEKGRSSVMDGIPPTLPSLLYADKVQRKAAALGLDWPDAGSVWPAVAAELDELRAAIARAGSLGASGPGDVAGSGGAAGSGRAVGTGAEEGPAPDGEGAVAAELGDVLFSVINLGRKLGVDSEAALRGATARFRRRVQSVELLAAQAGIDTAAAAPEVVDQLWVEAKRRSG